MTEQPDYEVLAIRYCHREAQRYEHFYDRVANGTESMPMAYYVWLIRGGDRTIVVDTGFTRQTAEARGRDYVASPIDSLARLGVHPQDVDTVILTHLHFDHTGNVHSFPTSTFVLQEAELAFWCGPHAKRQSFSHSCTPEDLRYLVDANLAGRIDLINGDKQIAPGVTVHLLGGHTPGMQVVCVQTSAGPIVLASDASHFYENVLTDHPYAIAHTLPRVYDGFDRLRALASDEDRIVPGHDPKVLERYPALSGELTGIVVQLTPHNDGPE